jgi:hypothetical protein
MYQFRRKFIIGIGSQGYGGQTFLWSVICKLQDQDSSGIIHCESVGDDGVNLQVQVLELPVLHLRAKVGAHLSLNRKKWVHLSSSYSTDWMIPTYIGESNCLYSAPNSNINLFLKYPHPHSEITEIMVKQLYGHPIVQSSWNIK